MRFNTQGRMCFGNDTSFRCRTIIHSLLRFAIELNEHPWLFVALVFHILQHYVNFNKIKVKKNKFNSNSSSKKKFFSSCLKLRFGSGCKYFSNKITNEINSFNGAELSFPFFRPNLLAYLCFLERSQFKHIF